MHGLKLTGRKKEREREREREREGGGVGKGEGERRATILLGRAKNDTGNYFSRMPKRVHSQGQECLVCELSDGEINS